MGSIRRLTKASDLISYMNAFMEQIHYVIPWQILIGEEVWALYEGDKIVGGFAFVSKGMPRSIQQIPEELRGTFSKGCIRISKDLVINEKDVAEITGYWLSSKKNAGIFTVWFVLRALLHSCKYFVYSYPVSQRKLGKYYNSANPIVLYRGEPLKLRGHVDNMEPESVELITAFGVFKIFCYRVKTIIRKKLGL